MTWMFWKKKKKLVPKDDLPIIKALKELKEMQTRFGDIAFCVFEGEKDLPAQTRLFYEQMEFALASYISCLGIHKRNVLINYGKQWLNTGKPEESTEKEEDHDGQA